MKLYTIGKGCAVALERLDRVLPPSRDCWWAYMKLYTIGRGSTVALEGLDCGYHTVE